METVYKVIVTLEDGSVDVFETDAPIEQIEMMLNQEYEDRVGYSLEKVN